MVEMGDRTHESEAFLIENNETPYLITAQILADRRLGVEVVNLLAPDGRLLSGYVSIKMSEKGEEILDRVCGTLEYRVLSFCYEPYLSRIVDHRILDVCCTWDDDTKRRIQALYWQQLAERQQSIAMRERERGKNPNSLEYLREYYLRREKRFEETARASLAKSEELLGKNLNPLTPEEIRSLLEQVVSRVLAPSPQTS